MGGTITKEDLEKWYNDEVSLRLSETSIASALQFWEAQERAPVITAVCDAIEEFCEATCGCEGSIFYRGICYRCGNRIIEQFEIVGGGDE